MSRNIFQSFSIIEGPIANQRPTLGSLRERVAICWNPGGIDERSIKQQYIVILSRLDNKSEELLNRPPYAVAKFVRFMSRLP